MGSAMKAAALLAVFIGAGIGGTLRHAVNEAALRMVGAGFPVATLGVNIIGSLVMGLFVGWFALRFDPGQEWRLFLTTGLLGGFTTFSTFSLDTAVMIERGAGALALAYVLLSVFLSIGALFVGLALVRYLA
jgi:fluoride exporter